LAHVRRRGPYTYEIRVYLGRDASGKKKYLIETFHGTKGQAQRQGAELEVLHRPRVSGPQKAAVTLGEYLEKRWLPKVKTAATERTGETYEWHVRRLLPAVGHLPLYGLTAGDLQDALDSLQGSPVTRRKIIGTLKTALRQAVAWGLIPSDPTEGLLLPRKPSRTHRTLNREQLIRYLGAAGRTQHPAILRLLAVTGMRLGEALGLKWEDVDFDRGTVTVRRGIDTRRSRSKPEGDETKTPAARRTIRLDGETLALLAELKQRQAKQKVLPLRQEEAFVFTNLATGKLVSIHAVHRAHRRALKLARLPHIRIHDLRHTAASVLLDAGVPVTTVADLLGHSTPATTVALYAHPIRRGQALAELLDSQKDSRDG